MTAVDLTTPVGQPLDLAAVMDRRPAIVPDKPAAAGQSGFSFGDFIDIINPLQHIPGIAELYRSVTNDQISDEARKTGNALYGFALGGPVGLGAMLAYNAVGDRLQGGSETPVQVPVVTADAAPSAEAAEGPSKDKEIPVPLRKPDLDPEQAVRPDLKTALLGETVAQTGNTSSDPVPALSGLLSSGATTTIQNGASPEAGTAASSVVYVDATDPAPEPAVVLPTETGLNRLATHQSNHLPLDVLKALQERHAERSASERS